LAVVRTRNVQGMYDFKLPVHCHSVPAPVATSTWIAGICRDVGHLQGADVT
jgi:hypothetical protein